MEEGSDVIRVGIERIQPVPEIVSGIILYLVYGVGARDLGEHMEIREKRRKRLERFRQRLLPHRKSAVTASPPESDS